MRLPLERAVFTLFIFLTVVIAWLRFCLLEDSSCLILARGHCDEYFLIISSHNVRFDPGSIAILEAHAVLVASSVVHVVCEFLLRTFDDLVIGRFSQHILAIFTDQTAPKTS